MMHIAMYESINALEPRYQPYRHKLEPPAGASRDAAAAVAAARMLSRLHPDAAPKVEAELKPYLAKLADQPGGPAALEAGAAVGEKVAAPLCGRRADAG